MPPPRTLAEGQILTGAVFNEPMRVGTVAETGPNNWTLGLVSTRSERFREVSPGAAKQQLLTLEHTSIPAGDNREFTRQLTELHELR